MPSTTPPTDSRTSLERPWCGGCVEQSFADGGGVRAEKAAGDWSQEAGRELFVVVEFGGLAGGNFREIFSTQKKRTSPESARSPKKQCRLAIGNAGFLQQCSESLIGTRKVKPSISERSCASAKAFASSHLAASPLFSAEPESARSPKKQCRRVIGNVGLAQQCSKSSLGLSLIHISEPTRPY